MSKSLDSASALLAEKIATHADHSTKAETIGSRLAEERAGLKLKEAAKADIIQALAEGAGVGVEDKPGMAVAIKTANQGVVEAQGRVDLLHSVHCQAIANAATHEAEMVRARNVHTRQLSKELQRDYADDLEQVGKLAAQLDAAFSQALGSAQNWITAVYSVSALAPHRPGVYQPFDDGPSRLDKLAAALP